MFRGRPADGLFSLTRYNCLDYELKISLSHPISLVCFAKKSFDRRRYFLQYGLAYKMYTLLLGKIRPTLRIVPQNMFQNELESKKSTPICLWKNDRRRRCLSPLVQAKASVQARRIVIHICKG